MYVVLDLQVHSITNKSKRAGGHVGPADMYGSVCLPGCRPYGYSVCRASAGKLDALSGGPWQTSCRVVVEAVDGNGAVRAAAVQEANAIPVWSCRQTARGRRLVGFVCLAHRPGVEVVDSSRLLSLFLSRLLAVSAGRLLLLARYVCLCNGHFPRGGGGGAGDSRRGSFFWFPGWLVVVGGGRRRPGGVTLHAFIAGSSRRERCDCYKDMNSR